MDILEVFQAALTSRQQFEVEGRLRRRDGEFRWFLFRGSPLRDQSGKVVKWFETNTDIEDHKAPRKPSGQVKRIFAIDYGL